MRFGSPLAFLLLLAVPLWLVGFFWLERRRARRIERAGDADLIHALVLADGDGGRARRSTQAILVASAIGLAALALARPELGMRTELRKARGIDLVIALDLSKSMLARDVIPSRLDRARIEIGELIDRLKGDRIGLVGFTSVALPLCPLTVDHSALLLQLKSAAPDDLPRGGTAIAQAIEASERMLTTSRARGAERAILVITDGEDNEGDAIAAAKHAKEAGITVHVVGVGSRTGEPIPTFDTSGNLTGYMKDRAGQTVVSRLNEKMLRDVAETTGGLVTLPSEAGGLDLGPIRTHLSTLKKAELDERTVRVYEERYQWVLAPAILALWLATILRPTRRASARITLRGATVTASEGTEAVVATARHAPTSIASKLGRRFRGTGPSAAVILLLALSSARAEGAGPLEREDEDASAGRAALSQGKPKDAIEAYSRAMTRLGEDPRLLLDRGLAEAQGGELDRATSDLRAAMEGGKSSRLRADAAFALGNTYRKLKKWNEALDAYRRTLLEDPTHTAARRNLEITSRMKAIEAMQPRDPNKKNQDGDKPPQNDRDGGTNDAGERGDGGSTTDGGPSSSEGQDGGTSGDGGGRSDDSHGAGDAGSSERDGSSGSSGSGDGGSTGDAGGATPESAEPQPSNQEAQPESSPEQKNIEEMLDALKAQEKAIKRQRLMQKLNGKQVEKDW